MFCLLYRAAGWTDLSSSDSFSQSELHSECPSAASTFCSSPSLFTIQSLSEESDSFRSSLSSLPPTSQTSKASRCVLRVREVVLPSWGRRDQYIDGLIALAE